MQTYQINICPFIFQTFIRSTSLSHVLQTFSACNVLLSPNHASTLAPTVESFCTRYKDSLYVILFNILRLSVGKRACVRVRVRMDMMNIFSLFSLLFIHFS